MKINPYLSFKGNCAEAFQFYEQSLRGKITMMMTCGESPLADEAPAEQRDKILHACLRVGDWTLLGGDCPPALYEKPKGFSLSIGIDDPVEAERIFNELAENGTVQMPLQQTFWSKKFGMLVDRFGIPWMINCE